MSMGFAKEASILRQTIKRVEKKKRNWYNGEGGEVYHVRPKYDPCSGAGKAQ